MRQLEHLHRRRALYRFALLLWLALHGAGATASVPMRPEAGPAAAPSMASGSMPMTTNCMPCALCCIAPAPTRQGFSSECQEPAAPIWGVHALPAPASAWLFDRGVWRTRLPVRIAYCRWLD